MRLGLPAILVWLLSTSTAWAQLPHGIPDFCVGSPDTVGPSQVMTISGQVAKGCIRVESGGRLIFTSNSTLTVDMIFGLPGSSIEGGTPTAPLSNVVIIGRDGPMFPNDPEQWGRGFLSFGVVRLHGLPKTAFAEVTADPLAGQTQISVALAGAVAGDRLYIPGTRQDDPKADIEVRTVGSATASSVTLQAPLQFNHRGALWVDGTTMGRPHVGNLTRSITIRSQNPTGTRWHVAFIDRADVDIRYVAFVDLGRTVVTMPTGSGNQIGRYPLHLHHLYGPTSGQPNGRQYTLIGNVIEGGSKWGVTVHGTHYGLVQDNVVYNTGGAGIMTEDGSETENLIDHNLVVAPFGNGGEDDPTQLGSQQSGLWFRGPNNRVTNNVVANVSGNTVAYTVGTAPFGLGSIVSIPLGPGQPPTSVVDNRYRPILQFKGNTMYASTHGIILWDILAQCCTEVHEGPESLIEDTTVWHIDRYGTFPYATNRLRFLNWKHAGEPGMLSSASNWPIGFVFGDYLTSFITVENARVENLKHGYWIPIKHGDMRDIYGAQVRTSLILDSVFRNVNNFWDTRPYGVTGGGVNLPNRMLDVRRTVCGNPSQNQWPSKCVKSDFDLGYGPNVNIVTTSRIAFTDFNRDVGDTFDVYMVQQAPGFIVPQSGSVPGLIASPSAGLTNTQNLAQHGIAISNAIAPCSTSRSGFDGFVCGGTQPPPPDTIAPVTTVTVPTGTLKDTITIGATCTDAVGCVSVRLEVDGADVGADLTAPYSFVFNTLSVADGSHTFRVVGRDAAGNAGPSNTETRTVDNSAPPPTDADGDGVPDSLDQCPGTPPGTTVDATGCPVLPQNPCVVDPLTVTRIAWPSTNSGRRSVTFDTRTKTWATFRFDWLDPNGNGLFGVLTVTDTRGCVVTVVR